MRRPLHVSRVRALFNYDETTGVLSWPLLDIEHIDDDRANDRWANLECMTRSRSRKPDIDDLYEAEMERLADMGL